MTTVGEKGEGWRKGMQTTWASVVAKAWKDPAFKQKLIENPNKVLAENGMEVPQGVRFVIVENEENRVNLVLPNPPTKPLAVEQVNLTSLSDYDPGF